MRDWDYEFSLLRLEDDARAFPDDVIHGPQYESPEPERRTLQERRELRIAEGECPMPGCGGSLDEDFFCSQCGNTSLPGQQPETPGPPDLPTFPLALTLDEYAEAQVDL